MAKKAHGDMKHIRESLRETGSGAAVRQQLRTRAAFLIQVTGSTNRLLHRDRGFRHYFDCFH